VFGFLLTLGTGDWWMPAALASRPPTFGVTDPVLHKDLGYYLAQLPWSQRLLDLALLAVCTATAVVTLLYAGIGSLRFRRWLPYANAHARAHLGVLLALLALTLTWGAILDPAETVAGLHGTIARRALDARLAAAPFVASVGAATTVVSLVWGLRERPVLLVTAWGALLAASLLGFAVIPGSLAGSPAATRGRGGADSDTALAAERRRLEGLAFGVTAIDDRAPPGFPSPEAATTAVPIWDLQRVLAATASRRELVRPQSTPAAAGLWPHSVSDGRATWLVALRPDVDSVVLQQPPPRWAVLHRGPLARVGRPVAAVEDDTLLAFAAVATRDSTTWFGPRFTDFAVAAPDSWPALRHSGIELEGWWRRTALAWALQSPALARPETDGLVLLWRRDVPQRLARLAPFASFADAVPVLADSALWWVAYGYLEADAFPLARPVHDGGGMRDSLRYLRTGLLGTVNAASGDTRLYLAPGADSLAAAWARLLAPLIRPLDSLPRALRTQLPFPARTFRTATALVERWRSDTTIWGRRPREPFEIVAPTVEGAPDAPRVWMGQGFEAGSTLAALVTAAMTPDGPRLSVWRPNPAPRLPPVLVGSPNTTAPGVSRLWNVARALFSEQALFSQPAAASAPTGIDTVFLSWGEHRGQARSVAAALRNLLACSVALTGFALHTFAQTAPPLLLRNPSLSADKIAFLYADDVWTVSREGGEARRLTSVNTVVDGPYYSPDGARIAYTGVAVRDLSQRRAVRPKNMPPSPTASPCVFAGDTLYCSAKSGFIPGPNSGVYAATTSHQAHQTMRNQLDNLEEAEMKFDQVVFTTVYLDDLSDMPLFEKVYHKYFTAIAPARVNVQQIAPHDRKPNDEEQYPDLEQMSLIAVRSHPKQ